MWQTQAGAPPAIVFSRGRTEQLAEQLCLVCADLRMLLGDLLDGAVSLGELQHGAALPVGDLIGLREVAVLTEQFSETLGAVAARNAVQRHCVAPTLAGCPPPHEA